MAKALGDIKVLDFTRAAGGPVGTMLLSQWGAEVIKIEIPGGGDTTRTGPPFTKGGEGGRFIGYNRGKKSITLNLASEKGREIARDLSRKVDVLVENFSPGVMDRLVLSYEQLSRLNPKLIYASLSGYGHTGPRRSELALDLIAQAMGGLVSVTGFPDGLPVAVGIQIGDYLGGFHTTMAILAALHYRSLTGEGQMIDISLQDCVWSVTALSRGPTYFISNEVPQRHGNSHEMGVPWSIYEAKDGYVVICVGNVRQWQSFLSAIGREDLLGVEKYLTTAGRFSSKGEVSHMVEEWTKQKKVEEILSKLKKADVPCSPVPSFDQVANDPQLLSREMVVEVEQRVSGKVKVPGSVFKMSKTPGNPKLPTPFLGEHNYEIYSEMLGYSEPEINKLADDGVI